MASQHAAILVREGAESGDKTINLDIKKNKPFRIGRSRKLNDYALPEEVYVSRQHAEIIYKDQVWYLRDLSLNGTRVNDKPVIDAVALRHDDRIHLGETTFRFMLPKHSASQASKDTVVAQETEETLFPNPDVGQLPPRDLRVLCRFMATCVKFKRADELLQEAVNVLHKHMPADVVSFLSPDEEEPVVCLTVPDGESVPKRLAEDLVRESGENVKGQTIWAGDNEYQGRLDMGGNADAVSIPMRAHGELYGSIQAVSQENAFDNDKVTFAETLCEYVSNRLAELRRARRLEAENVRLKEVDVSPVEVLGEGGTVHNLRKELRAFGRTSEPALLIGPAGSGCDESALTIHDNSDRREGPFVRLDCRSIPQENIEAEVFGGTVDGQELIGGLEQARGGTLHLSGVSALPVECQINLVRAMDGQPYGQSEQAQQKVRADFRLVASDEDQPAIDSLWGELRNRFEDRVTDVPALSDHPEDIPQLVDYFVGRLSELYRRKAQVSPAAIKKFQGYEWPGNIPQLRMIIEYTLAAGNSDQIYLDATDFRLPTEQEEVLAMQIDRPKSLEWTDVEKWAIMKALEQTNHNISKASAILGMSRDTIHNRLREWDYNIKEQKRARRMQQQR